MSVIDLFFLILWRSVAIFVDFEGVLGSYINIKHSSHHALLKFLTIRSNQLCRRAVFVRLMPLGPTRGYLVLCCLLSRINDNHSTNSKQSYHVRISQIYQYASCIICLYSLCHCSTTGLVSLSLLH